MFEVRLVGWRDQQLARDLHRDTVEVRLTVVRRFARFTNDWPWNWCPGEMEAFLAELRGSRRTLSTIRGYQGVIRLFC